MESTAGESATTLLTPSVKVSDIQELTAPVAAYEEKKVEEPKVEETKVEDIKSEDVQTAEAEETIEVEGERIKKKGGFQRKIERQDREIAEMRQREERREAMLAQALAALEKGALPKAEEPTASQDKAPSRDDFEDYESYLDAKAEWKAMQTFRAEMARRDEQAAQKQEQVKQQEVQQTVDQQLEERKTKGREKYPDFEKVALDPSTPISPLMAEIIAGSDNGEDVAYFLGSHRDEALRIARLNPLAAAKEMGALEASLKAKPVATVKTTAAPTPTTPISVSGSANQDMANIDMDAYIEKRRAQGAEWARR